VIKSVLIETTLSSVELLKVEISSLSWFVTVLSLSISEFFSVRIV
jgi:hypothetical protein